MIYTLTLNPAIDLFIDVDELLPNKVNRSNYDEYIENGKGVNVSRILHMMGIKNTALGFIAGFTGKFIKDKLEESGISTNFIEVDGITRVNVFINAKEEFKIVNKGHHIIKEKIDEMIALLEKLEKDDYLFVCGSLPLGVDESIYKKIIDICQEKKVRLIIDTSSKKIINYLKKGIYLMKPNDEELASFFDIEHKLSEEEIEIYGKKLIELGCDRLIVSRGAEGAVYIDKNIMVCVNAPDGKVINTACSGDTLLGSFIGKCYLGESIEDAMMFASASASSTAFTEGITDFKNVPELLKQVKINKLIKF